MFDMVGITEVAREEAAKRLREAAGQREKRQISERVAQ
jgi:hypothetical protein